MNKKSLLVLAICLLAIFLIPSCKKDTVTKTITVTDTVTNTDTVRTRIIDTVQLCAGNSTLALFTHKQWIPDTIYINYTGPGTGSIVYIRGSNSNIQNYHDGDRGIFWVNGYEDAFDANGYTQWTWSFNGTDTTSFTGNDGFTTNHVKILKLTPTRLTVQDSTFQTYSADEAQP
jgi:hypothetical protein